MRIEFGVGMGRNLRIDEVADHARVAEESGFSRISFIDSQNLSRDVYSMMTIAALNTDRIRIGHGVTVPFTRHPSVTANATATVNELSGGRAFLGIGAGMSAVWTMGMKARPHQEFRETIQFTKRYMLGEEAEFKGAKMQSEWIRRPVPIYVACRGPRACQLAGELGDGAFISDANPVAIKWKMELMEKGALKAGRDPSEIDVAIRASIYIAESKEAARYEVASQAATNNYVPRLPDTPEVADLRKRIERAEPGLLDEMQQAHEGYDAYQHERTDAPHGKLVTQRMIDFLMLTGTVDDICEQIYGIQQVGVKTIFAIVYTIIDKKGMMREIGNKIIPHFRS